MEKTIRSRDPANKKGALLRERCEINRLAVDEDYRFEFFLGKNLEGRWMDGWMVMGGRKRISQSVGRVLVLVFLDGREKSDFSSLSFLSFYPRTRRL